MKRLVILAALAMLLLAGCAVKEKPASDKTENTVEKTVGDKQEKEIKKKSAVEAKIESMDLSEKLWQLFFVTPEAVLGRNTVVNADGTFIEAAAKRPVGGIILFGKNIVDQGQVTRLLCDMAVGFETPAFFGVDEEGGRVTRLSKSCGVTDNGAMSQVKDSGEAADIGRRLGTELSGLGFNVDFAPVADVIVNPNNTEIGNRSFGTDPEHVADMVAAQVKGMQSRGISAVLKHFPGHASTVANSHKGKSVSERTLEELRLCELKPFESGIEAGADFVMVSHMSLPEVTGSDAPCSLSRAVIDGILREELGFSKIIITDALNMGAVDEYDSSLAGVLAVEAGADMLLMPEDLDAAFEGLLEAVESGRITEARIDESVKRILTVKHRLGLI